MKKQFLVLISIGVLIVGLLIGFFLHDPVVNATNLHAGGLPIGSENGVWTGSEYAKPWLWTQPQWSNFIGCVGRTGYDVGFTPGSATPSGGTGSVWSSCAGSTISNSPFSGITNIALSTVSRQAAGTFGVTISKTGAISGTLITPASQGLFPTGTPISGYINPNGQLTILAGKTHLVGTMFITGFYSKINTPMYTGESVDQDGLQSVPGLTLLKSAPYISDGVPAANITPGVSIYSIDAW